MTTLRTQARIIMAYGLVATLVAAALFLDSVKASPRQPAMQTTSVTSFPCWTAATPATCNTFTFDIPRVLDSATICALRGNGYVTATTDAGETAKRWFVTTTPACSSPFVWTLPFTKLANSVTFSYGYTDPTQYTVTGLAIRQRVPSSITFTTPATLIINGVTTAVGTSDFTINVTSTGALITFPPSATSTCLPYSVNDANGQIGQGQTCTQPTY